MRMMCFLFLSIVLTLSLRSFGDTPPPAPASPAGSLDELVSRVVRQVQAENPNDKLKVEDVAVTVMDLRDPAHPRVGSWNGEQAIYPASVVKLFYLVATHQWLEEKKLADSEELQRTLKDMIVDSSNDATGAVVDALAGVGNGEPLPEDQMKEWTEKRNAVNRYFASLGYSGINICQKAYTEGPYGRERIFLGKKYEKRNKLTTNATARLLSEIVAGKAVTPDRSKAMMDLLKRNPAGKPQGNDDQNTGFIAKGLPAGSKLWSKAGWTSTARHDAAYVEAPEGLKFVLVIFTTGHANQRGLLPAIAKSVIEGMTSEPAKK